MKRKCENCNYEGTMLIRVDEGEFFHECPNCKKTLSIPYVNAMDYGNDEYADILDLMNQTDDYMFTHKHISNISKAGFDINVYLHDNRALQFTEHKAPEYFDVDELQSLFIYGNWIKVHVLLNEADCHMGYALREE